MTIKSEDVKHVAKLARLKLKNEQIGYFAGQLTKIVDYIGQLKEVDTDNTESTSHVVDLKNIYREDESQKPLKDSQALQNAPASVDRHFKVTRIIEEA